MMILPAIEALLGRTDSAALLLSGKDSIVAGIACKNAGVRIVGAAYMYLVPGLKCITDPLRAVADAIGCPFYEVPHYDLARMTRWGVLGYPAPWCAKTLSYDAVRNYVRKLTGVEWIVEGVRNQEVRQKYHRDRVERTNGLGGNQVCQAIYNARLEWVREQFRPGGIAKRSGYRNRGLSAVSPISAGSLVCALKGSTWLGWPTGADTLHGASIGCDGLSRLLRPQSSAGGTTASQ